MTLLSQVPAECRHLRAPYCREAQRNPPHSIAEGVDEFDPDGTAVVVGTFLNETDRFLGRPFLNHRRQAWIALEDKTVVDDLYKKLRDDRESFWTAVYPLYMARDITRQNVRDVIRKGLEEAKGNYKIVCRLFNMEAGDYKKFLNFLRKHDCQLPFKEYRQ